MYPGSFIFIAAWCSLGWLCCHSFIHSPVDGHLSGFPFGAITKEVRVDIPGHPETCILQRAGGQMPYGTGTVTLSCFRTALGEAAQGTYKQGLPWTV